MRHRKSIAGEALKKRSTRILLAGIVLELMQAGIGWHLLDAMARGDLTPAGSQAETATTILTVIGGAMGVLAGIVIAAFFVMRARGA